MERRQSKQVSELIMLFLRSEGLETPYNQYRIKKAWPEVMGPAIAKLTGEMFFKGQTLHIQIKSPALKNDLSLQRKVLAQRLNQHINAQVINDILFY